MSRSQDTMPLRYGADFFGATTAMDQTRDASGRGLYQLVQLFPPPDYVKEASAADLCGGPELPAHVYADPRHRLYPCSTPAATWTSYGFFLQKRADYRREDAAAIADIFAKYAKYHDIVVDLDNMEKLAAVRFRVRTEEELPDDDFAFLVHGSDGSVERHCAMRNGLETVKAAEYLFQYRDEFPFPVRLDAANRILQKAASLGVSFPGGTPSTPSRDGQPSRPGTPGPLEEFLEKQAGHGTCVARELAEALVDRVQASRKGPGDLSATQVEMLKMAKLVVTKPSQIREPGALAKIAGVLDQFDREHLLHRGYGPGLPRPEDVVFGLTREKIASVVQDHCSTVTGSIFKMADLERLRLRDVAANMGDSFAEAISGDGLGVDVEKMAAIVPTLPRDDAMMFERMLEDLGIQPIAREKAAAAVKISRDYLRQMAEDFRQTAGIQGPKKGPKPGGLLASFKA